jgi:hypothetical protein
MDTIKGIFALFFLLVWNSIPLLLALALLWLLWARFGGSLHWSLP